MGLHEKPLPIDAHFKNARRIAHEHCRQHMLDTEAEQNLEIEIRQLLISQHNDIVKTFSANIVKEITHTLSLKFGYK